MQHHTSVQNFNMPAAIAEQASKRLSEPSIVITIDEATRLLCVGRTTIYKLLNERALTWIKVGNATRILRASLDTYLKQAAI